MGERSPFGTPLICTNHEKYAFSMKTNLVGVRYTLLKSFFFLSIVTREQMQQRSPLTITIVIFLPISLTKRKYFFNELHYQILSFFE